MPKSNTNIKTIADLSSIQSYENASPNVRTTNQQSLAAYEGKSNNSNNNNDSNHKYRSDTTGISAATTAKIPAVYHIPTLQNDQEALQLLQRVVQEFIPIIQRRKYNVISISELCCCHDGLDFSNNDSTTTNNNQKKKKRRKLNKMSNNIWGYNRTMWSGHQKNKQHTIHLRLRHATDHTKFLLYEDVAGTLAHELSHCEFGPHDAKFFKLMDEILDEHANLMATSMTSSVRFPFHSSTGIPSTTMNPFSGMGQTLGSAAAVVEAEANGSSNWTGLGPGRRLGEDGFGNFAPTTTGHTLGGDLTFVQWMTPKEAAIVAAETRRRQQQLRLRGDHCCRPCYNDIDTIENDNSSINDDVCIVQEPPRTVPIGEIAFPRKNNSADNPILPENIKNMYHNWADIPKAPPPRSSNVIINMSDVIDLTTAQQHDDDDDDETYHFGNNDTTVKRENTDRKLPATTSPRRHGNVAKQPHPWKCHCCTFDNRPLALVCDMCGTIRDLLPS